MGMKNKILAVGFAVLALGASLPAADLTLWYQQPVGGRVNEPTTGSPGQPAVGLGGGQGSPAMNEALPIGNGRMGALIFGPVERERICVNESSLWTGDANPTGDYNQMGSYQVLGDIFVNLPDHPRAADYRRDLELGNALAQVDYTADGVKFQREFFCSHPAEILAVQFTADHKAAYTGSIELNDSHDAKIVADGNRLTASGTLANGMKF